MQTTLLYSKKQFSWWNLRRPNSLPLICAYFRVMDSRSNQAQNKINIQKIFSIILMLNSIHFERIGLHQVVMHSLDMLPDTFFIAIKFKHFKKQRFVRLAKIAKFRLYLHILSWFLPILDVFSSPPAARHEIERESFTSARSRQLYC